MKRTFVETTSFSRRVDQAGAGVLQEIEVALLKNLESGRVMQGTGGLRKLRMANTGRGKGKRGGYRVIYLDLASVERTYLLALYDKDERDDVSPEERRVLRALVDKLKQEVR